MKKAVLPVVSHIGHVEKGQRWEAPHALAALAALGQATRLEIFRLLMSVEPEGLPAGVVADKIGCPHNTLSSHLSIMARSGLVRGVRDGRSIVYHADVDTMRALIGFLVNDCCGGHPELCNLKDTMSKAGGNCVPAKASGRTRSGRS